jgi:hypothetical protein
VTAAWSGIPKPLGKIAEVWFNPLTKPSSQPTTVCFTRRFRRGCSAGHGTSGMGTAALQQANRDTQRFGIKCSDLTTIKETATSNPAQLNQTAADYT